MSCDCNKRRIIREKSKHNQPNKLFRRRTKWQRPAQKLSGECTFSALWECWGGVCALLNITSPLSSIHPKYFPQSSQLFNIT